MIDLTSIPEYMKHGVMSYVENGVKPGDFLCAVLCNNLADAAAHADDTNKHYLYEWGYILHCELPHDCWGSKKIMDEWIAKGGLDGKAKVPD